MVSDTTRRRPHMLAAGAATVLLAGSVMWFLVTRSAPADSPHPMVSITQSITSATTGSATGSSTASGTASGTATSPTP